ncbi:MAG TPA: NlpC/P60 family protein [Candidatus Saccharimonadia bacterium]|jgi:cell wall-associated NlpC family hydrolase
MKLLMWLAVGLIALGTIVGGFFLLTLFVVAGAGTPVENSTVVPGCSGSARNLAAPAAVTVRSTQLNSAQVHNAETIIGVAKSRGLSARDAAIGVATAMQESTLINLTTPDAVNADSIGLFQQRPSMGWGTPQQLANPVYAANRFYDALVTIKNRDSLPLTVAAQEVQHSAYPNAYAQWEPMSTALANQAYQGGGSAGVGTTNPAGPFSLAASATGCNAPSAVTTTAVVNKAVRAALSQLGVPYVWGGTTPKGRPGAGLDCSGLTQYAYSQAGVAIPRVANDQYNAAHKIPLTPSALLPGDLLFENWNESGPGTGWGHVGMYIGNGQVIQEPHTGLTAEVVSFSQFGAQAAARPVLPKVSNPASSTPSARRAGTNCTPARPCTVFGIGDSILNLLDLDSILTKRSFGPGWTYVHNASGGRGVTQYGGITVGGTGYDAPITGDAAVFQDASVVRTASAIVIELGTNPNESGQNCPGPDNFAASVQQMVHDIRSIAGHPVRLYWVNIGNQRSDSCAWTINPRNHVLSSLASPLGFQVIDWHGVAAHHPEWFNADPIHPNTAGQMQLAQLITSAVAGGNLRFRQGI